MRRGYRRLGESRSLPGFAELRNERGHLSLSALSRCVDRIASGPHGLSMRHGRLSAAYESLR